MRVRILLSLFSGFQQKISFPLNSVLLYRTYLYISLRNLRIFCLLMEGSGRIRICTNNYYSGSWRPKTFRIQIRFRMRNTDSNLDIFSGELPSGIVHEDFPHCFSYLRRVVAATHEPYKPKDVTPNSRSDIISQH
jgi:hypothetical protein